MNEWQELVKAQFGLPYDQHLYKCILQALEGCTDRHEALRKLYDVMDRIEHVTEVIAGVAKQAPHSSSHVSP